MKKKVLIVDDDRTIHAILRSMLRDEFEVVSAVDALQGVSFARQLKPDLIILDVQMPAGGGESVYQRIKALNDTWQIPILFYTSSSVEQVREKIPEALPEHILIKPTTADALRDAVTRLLP